MAKQTSVIKFTGKLGDLTGYRCGKKHYLRTRPEQVHQTPATKQAAQDFGIISRKGKIIRKAILPLLDLCYDGTTGNRLTRQMVLAARRLQQGIPSAQDLAPSTHPHALATQAMAVQSCILPRQTHTSRCDAPRPDHQLQALQGFRFNQYTGIGNILSMPPVYTPEDGLVTLPAQAFCRQSKSASFMEVKAVAVRINFSERRVVATDEAIELIDLSQPFTGISLHISAPGKGTLFIILQLRACLACNGKVLPLGDRRYMAADIIAIMPPQKPGKKQKPNNKNKLKKQPPYGAYSGRPLHHIPVNKPANRPGYQSVAADIPSGVSIPPIAVYCQLE